MRYSFGLFTPLNGVFTFVFWNRIVTIVFADIHPVSMPNILIPVKEFHPNGIQILISVDGLFSDVV